jgi:hypothetical protein
LIPEECRRIRIDSGLWGSNSIVRAFERNPTFGPTADFAEWALKLATLQCKLVFDSDRTFRDDSADDEILRLQGTKALGQHPIGDIWNRGLDGRVACLSL